MKNLFLIQIQKLYEKYFVPLNELEKQKIVGYFYIALTLFAVSFFGYFAISPTLNTVTNLNKQYEDNQLIYNALTLKLKNLRNLDNQFVKLQNILPQIDSAIPKNTQIPKLTRQLENLAVMENVEIIDLAFNTIELYPYSDIIPIFSYLFTINVTGSRNEVESFMRTILRFDRIIGIERIDTGRNQESKYTLSLTGRAFFAPK